MSILYRPNDGVLADVIPFYWRGAYHLFYLKDYRDPQRHGEGTPWFHLVTRDFVRFEEWGEALPRGAPDEQDRWVFTGSVIEAEGAFHIFYTGHNPHFRATERPVQAVMRARSADLLAWEKDAAFRLSAPEGYEPDDWRDPFVFWNAEAGAYWMLLAARRMDKPRRHSGCVALAVSRDLERWKVGEPLWAPDMYVTHECPDLFRIGAWWYLVYSTFSERSVTHYRMARDLGGPWLCPADDTFDARAFYAAKTAGNGARRYAFGWLPTREGECDQGRWQWGGNLVVHELRQRANGTLAARMPKAVDAAFDREIPLRPMPILGEWDMAGDAFVAHSVGRFSALGLGDLPDECLIEATVRFEPGTSGLGLLLRADPGLEAYYPVRLEPGNQRLAFDRWPRPGDQPFVLERPLAMAPEQPVRLRVLLDGTCAVVYADDEVALSCRTYDHPEGTLALFVSEGKARFESVRVCTR